MGTLLKANFTVRLVGQVAPGQSQYATNRPGTYRTYCRAEEPSFAAKAPASIASKATTPTKSNQGQVTALARQIAREARRHNTRPVLEPVLEPHTPLLVVEPPRTASEPVLEPLRTGFRTTPELPRTAAVLRFPLTEKRA